MRHALHMDSVSSRYTVEPHELGRLLPSVVLVLLCAGLDYCNFIVVNVHKDWQAFNEFRKQQHDGGRLVAFSKFGRRHHATPDTYRKGDWLLFGAETTGLPAEVRRGA